MLLAETAAQARAQHRCRRQAISRHRLAPPTSEHGQHRAAQHVARASGAGDQGRLITCVTTSQAASEPSSPPTSATASPITRYSTRNASQQHPAARAQDLEHDGLVALALAGGEDAAGQRQDAAAQGQAGHDVDRELDPAQHLGRPADQLAQRDRA